MGKILQVEKLHVEIKTELGRIQAVRGVSFDLDKKETVAIVGESGSGKTITVKSVMQLLPSTGSITEGSVRLEGKELTTLSEKEMLKIRGSDISMIFQDPMTSLNPTMTVGNQIIEVLKNHRKDLSRDEMKRRAIEIIDLVGISNPETRFKQYPHQLSGGMRQRIIIAIALACDPKVLIADEPTTALDVTIQAQILDLMKELQEKINTSIIIITHNLGVVANIADRVYVMYGGKIVENGSVEDIFYHPQHPYTKGLLAAVPKLHEKTDKLFTILGTPPDLTDPPKGCPFAARCSYTLKVCRQYPPSFTPFGNHHESACWLHDPRAKRMINEVRNAG